MPSPADAIPDLERLMRDVLRRLFEAELGSEWLDDLSPGVGKAVAGAAGIARRERPAETLRDDWEAAGLKELSAAVEWAWPRLNGALSDVWSTPGEAGVDLDRLRAYRGKNLHAVGPPDAVFRDEEVGAMIVRLRIAFEGMRRRLASEEGEWWPYIEAIHSNVAEFNGARAALNGRSAVLREGDLVRLRVVGVHPTGTQDRLRYRLEVVVVGSGVPFDSG